MGRDDRFKDIEWYVPSGIACLVGGAGGISSWLIFLLSRAGFTCTVFDDDIIEEHNLGGQLYANDHVGRLKVESLSDTVSRYTGQWLDTVDTRYDSYSINHELMFCGFDNMQARKDFYLRWKEKVNEEDTDKGLCLFIDGRLLAEQYQIIAIRGTDEDRMQQYEEKYLFTDDEVDDAVCTIRQTSHIAAMMAGNMVSIITNHIANHKTRHNVRYIPFFTSYLGPLTLTETI